ncbi:OB-fold protein [Bartonella sp. LJL80]
MLKRLLAMVVIFGFALCSASAQMSLEEKEKKMLSTYIASQVFIYLKNGDSDYQFPAITKTKNSIKADDVSKDFYENELAAYKKYKKIDMIVEGKIARVRQELNGNIKILFDNRDVSPTLLYAVLKSDMIDEITKYKSGDQIALNCSGGIIKDLEPNLMGCIILPLEKNVAEKTGDLIAQHFLNGDDISNEMTTIKGRNAHLFLFTLKYITQYAPDNSPCLEFSTFESCDPNQFFPDNLFNQTEFKNAYESSMQKYHLPKLKWKD